MRRFPTLFAALACVSVLLGSRSAAADERILVLRGDRCPPGIGTVSADEALGSGASDCVLLDPALRARISPGAGDVVSAATCGARADAIAASGDVMCSAPRVAPPRAVERSAAQSSTPGDHVTIFGPGGPVRIDKGSFFQLFIKYVFLPMFVLAAPVALYLSIMSVRRRRGFLIPIIVVLFLGRIGLALCQILQIAFM